jgi:aspartyl-tRNA(Asn)/glutamyl-tRNA(Gln) amidotransferase subunit C
MKLTAKDVAHIAALSRLGLSEEEIKRAADDLTGVLNHFSSIQKIATEAVVTYDNATGLTNVTRKDEARPEQLCTAAILLEVAPQVKERHIKTPGVFEE